MNQNLLEKATSLKEKIDTLLEVKELERLNALLNENEEVMKLAYRKDAASTKYEDAIRFFGENSSEAKAAQKVLHQAKLALDENELVRKYNEAYKKVRKIYDKINEEIFNPFN